MDDFLMKLKKLRLTMSQEAIAREVGCSHYTISRIETGRNKASPMIKSAIERLFVKYSIKEE